MKRIIKSAKQQTIQYKLNSTKYTKTERIYFN